MSSTLDLACELIARPSITPKDSGCQDIMIARLQALGFHITRLPFGEVENFWARLGDQAPVFAFAGHTDVVPTGPENEWKYPPFQPTVDGGMLYGRGAADMKSSLAAMITATERFLKKHPHPKGSVAFLITSDEEGPSVDGTVRVVDYLQQRGESIQWCLVGEPSSHHRLGDVIKNGRRGSLNGKLKILGQQGHVAYPQLADNPIHRALPALAELSARTWDQGNVFFPATTFQISNLHSGTGADNVIPGTVELLFNFRFSTESTVEGLKQQVEQILATHKLRYQLEWRLSGLPFLTPPGELVDAVRLAIRAVTGIETELSTAGGTSDGRFIAPTGAQVIEVGPVNSTIHQINECVDCAALDELSSIYELTLTHLLSA